MGKASDRELRICPMTANSPVTVYGEDGPLGTIEPGAAGVDAEGRVLIRVDPELTLTVPRSFLREGQGGTVFIPLARDQLDRLREGQAHGAGERIVIPVVVEDLEARKRTVETGRVRVRKMVNEREELIDEPLLKEDVQVERVPVHRVVDGPVPVRQEGDTLVIPVVDEVLVVEKRLMLREELRVTRRRTEQHHSERVVLRGEQVIVERSDGRDPAAGS